LRIAASSLWFRKHRGSFPEHSTEKLEK
jgi:hypothetical protein